MIITIYIYIYTPINWIKILQVIEIWFSCVLDHKNQAPQLAPDSGTTREPGSDWLHGMGFGKPWDFFQDLFHRFHLKMIAKTGLDFGGFFECLRGRSSRTCGCYSIQRAACKKKLSSNWLETTQHAYMNLGMIKRRFIEKHRVTDEVRSAQHEVE